jgi:uncharacterized protein YeaO (DUF488 family)
MAARTRYMGRKGKSDKTTVRTNAGQLFGHDPARFAEFSRRYRAELSANKDAVDRIEELVKSGPVTLLYAAHDTEHNHARVLADYLARPSRRISLARAARAC